MPGGVLGLASSEAERRTYENTPHPPVVGTAAGAVLAVGVAGPDRVAVPVVALDSVPYRGRRDGSPARLGEDAAVSAGAYAGVSGINAV